MQLLPLVLQVHLLLGIKRLGLRALEVLLRLHLLEDRLRVAKPALNTLTLLRLRGIITSHLIRMLLLELRLLHLSI